MKLQRKDTAHLLLFTATTGFALVHLRAELPAGDQTWQLIVFLGWWIAAPCWFLLKSLFRPEEDSSEWCLPIQVHYTFFTVSYAINDSPAHGLGTPDLHVLTIPVFMLATAAITLFLWGMLASMLKPSAKVEREI